MHYSYHRPIEIATLINDDRIFATHLSDYTFEVFLAGAQNSSISIDLTAYLLRACKSNQVYVRVLN
jgi:hypothetical protein